MILVFFSLDVLSLVLGTTLKSLAKGCFKLTRFTVDQICLAFFEWIIVLIAGLHQRSWAAKFYNWRLTNEYGSLSSFFTFKISFVYWTSSESCVCYGSFLFRFHGRDIIFPSPVQKIKSILGLKESRGIIFFSFLSFHSSFDSFLVLTSDWKKFELALVHGWLSYFQIYLLIFEKVVCLDAINTHVVVNFIFLVFDLLLVVISFIDCHPGLGRHFKFGLFWFASLGNFHWMKSKLLLFWK